MEKAQAIFDRLCVISENIGIGKIGVYRHSDRGNQENDKYYIFDDRIHLTSGTFLADFSDSNVFSGPNPITNPKMMPGNILNREL